jgi:chromosome segregation ATPase
MSKVYESLKEVVQETLQRNKANSMVLTRVKGGIASSLTDEMEELEKIVADRIARLKAVVKEGEAVVAGETQHAAEVIESLRSNIAALEAKHRETEDTVRRKDLASEKMEVSLSGKIHDLQNEVKNKEESLKIRANEVKVLKSKVDSLEKQATQLAQATQEAKDELASEAMRVEHLTENSQKTITALEAQLKKTEETVRGKDSTIKGLEQNHTARIQDLENQVRHKEELLAGRDEQIDDLKSQVKVLTNGIKDMSSFFKQAEALAAIEAQDNGKVSQNGQLKNDQEKSTISKSKNPKVTSNKKEALPETVSPEFFNRMTLELTQTLGPMASVIVRDRVEALGESMEKFPKTRVTELLETVSEEILDENLKNSFRELLGLWPFCGGLVAGT